MPQVRKSRQRDAILCNLQSRCDHPTAMELYLSVREEIPSLSLGTLYRNLNTLCDDGQIMRLSAGGEEHFDAVVRNHAHLKCTKCGRFYDLPDLDGVLDSLPQVSAYAGEIHGCNLIFFGVCENCHGQTEQNI